MLLLLLLPLVNLPRSVTYKLDEHEGLNSRDVLALEELCE